MAKKKPHRPKFRIIDGCVVGDRVAPFIYLILRSAGHRAESIYRGEDAAWLLHRHGKHTQGEIHVMYPNISNPKGFSEHELFSDGVNKQTPRGEKLPWFEQGVDSLPKGGGDGNTPEQRAKINAAARKHGLKVAHHYEGRQVEGHHWCIVEEPVVKNPLRKARIWAIRKSLPTR